MENSLTLVMSTQRLQANCYLIGSIFMIVTIVKLSNKLHHFLATSSPDHLDGYAPSFLPIMNILKMRGKGYSEGLVVEVVFALDLNFICLLPFCFWHFQSKYILLGH